VLFLDRRGFLGLCASALTSGGASAQKPKASSAQVPKSSSPPLSKSSAAPYIYASESFVHSRNGPFALGFLVTAAPDRHIRALRDIKARTNYKRLMDYSSTDSLRLGCARAMLQYFVEDPELRFVGHARVGDFSADGARRGQYAALFQASGLPRESILRLKRRRPSRFAYNRRRGKGEFEVEARINDMVQKALIRRGEVIGREKNDTLVELSTLLTGALFGSHSRGGKLDELHPTKTVIVTRLRSLLRVSNLNERRAPKWELR
jgi:hypothetical protein